MFGLVKILEERDSSFNGKVQVVKTLEGVRIVAGGLSQSGFLVKKIWNIALKSIFQERKNVRRVLILGLGGGSSAEVVANYWPDSKITGVDIDHLIIELGKKYLNLSEIKNLKIIESDAQFWINKVSNNKKFDLILVDIYQGSLIPKDYNKIKFIKSLEGLLSVGGIVAFNQRGGEDQRLKHKQSLTMYKKVFPVIKTITPEANIISICFKE